MFSTHLIDAGILPLPDTQPGQASVIKPPASLSKNFDHIVGDVYFTVTVKLGSFTPWAAEGHEITFFQQKLSSASSISLSAGYLALSHGPHVQTTRSTWTVSGPGYSFIFDRARGCLKTWSRNGLDILQADVDNGHSIIPGFWRPATDNDVPHSYPYWQRFGVDRLSAQLRALDISTSNQGVIITSKTFMTPPILSWGWECTLQYVISRRGSLQVYANQVPTGSTPDHIPRIGLDIRLNKSLSGVMWYGLGPGESYPDKATAQKMGIWQVDSITELQTLYDVPQENGNRMETRWVQFKDPNPQSTVIRVRRVDTSDETTPFSFAASRHSLKTIQNAAHPTDLVEDDNIFLRLDAEVSGVGTAACGPGVRPDLMVKCKETKFAFEFEAL